MVVTVSDCIDLQKKMKRTQSEADMTSMAGGEAREESSTDTPSEPAFAFTLKKRSVSVDASVPGNTMYTYVHVLQEQNSKRLLVDCSKESKTTLRSSVFNLTGVNICAG